MNQEVIFWKRWSFKEKMALYLVLLFILTLVVYTFYSWFRGADNIISIDVVTELKEKAIQAPALFFDQFSFSSTTPLWYVTEFYTPSPVKVNQTAYYIMLGSTLLGVSLILAGLSRLKGVWFLAGALVLGGVLTAFRTESLFLVSRNWPFLTVFSIAGFTYFLTNLYAKKLDVFKTLLIWFAVWSLLILLVSKFAVINKPFVSLSAYGVIAIFCIAAVFIFLISHEILSALYQVVSSTAYKGRSSLSQFLIVTVVFAVNALLIYLENAKRIDKTSFVIAPVMIYVINLILGFWGFRNLSHQRGWFSFQGVGAWIYTGMALISSGLVAFAYATANEPLIELLEDFISISFLVVGLSFFVYVIINFLQLVRAGMAFHVVIYKSPYTRFLLARVAAVFLIFFVFSLKNRFSYFQLQAGLSNAIADFYTVEGDLRTAESFYKSAANYDLNNQRSNLSLAGLASQVGDRINAIFYYKQAGLKTPNIPALLGISQHLESESMFFEAIFALKEGLKDFPNDHRLYTNLARLQAKAGAGDSVLVNISKALDLCEKCEPENVNFLAFWLENGKVDKLAEMRDLAGKPKGFGFKANSAAIQRILGEEIILKDFNVAKDSALDMARAAYLLNTVSNPKILNETGVNAEMVRELQSKPGNENLYEQLSWGEANQQYYREDKLEGLKQMSFLADSPSNLASLYNQNLGLWLMREGAFIPAIERLRKAGDTSSVKLLSDSELKNQLQTQLKTQAETISKGLSLKNYKEILNTAPLNPFLVVKISDFLAANKKTLEAYNIIFYTQNWITQSPELLIAYIKRAIDLHMYSYAEEGLMNLKSLSTPGVYLKYEKLIDDAKSKGQDFN